MRTSTRPLTDRIMGGTLAEKLAGWRAAGESYEAIGRHLATDHDVHVSSSTVGRWCSELGVEPEQGSAA